MIGEFFYVNECVVMIFFFNVFWFVGVIIVVGIIYGIF